MRSCLFAIVCLCTMGQAWGQTHLGNPKAGIRLQHKTEWVKLRSKGKVLSWNVGREFFLYDRTNELLRHDRSSHVDLKSIPQGQYVLQVGAATYHISKEEDGVDVIQTL